MNNIKKIYFLLMILFLLGCKKEEEVIEREEIDPLIGKIEILEELDFDNSIFTQGLEYDGERLYFSGGLYGASSYGYILPGENKAKEEVEFDDEHFAKGLTLVGDKLYLLTWKEEELLVIDKDSLEVLEVLDYTGEAWGLAYDGESFFMSDGSETIFKRDENFNIVDEIRVYKDGKKITAINELEYGNDYLFANIWTKNKIIKIDPESGDVVKEYNLRNLLESTDISNEALADADVLNGIAHIEDDIFFITGKLWPKLFKIKLKS